MRVSKRKLYGVLTGDIVGFSKLPVGQRRRINDILKEGCRKISRVFKGSVPLDVDVFRGDSWQLLVSDAAISLRAALYLRAHLRASHEALKIDTRIAIGVGAIDFLPGDRVSKGDGPAYRISGSGLESMNKAGRMCFGFKGSDVEGAMDVIVRLTDVLAMNWSGRQARALTGALQGLTQEKIGALWTPPITQQSVNRHLQRAGWFAIEEAVAYFEKQLSTAVMI